MSIIIIIDKLITVTFALLRTVLGIFDWKKILQFWLHTPCQKSSRTQHYTLISGGKTIFIQQNFCEKIVNIFIHA